MVLPLVRHVHARCRRSWRWWMLRWVDYPNQEPVELQQQMWRILAERDESSVRSRDLSVRSRFLLAAFALPVLTSGAWFAAMALGLGVR
jgi:hypothetical protein